MQWTPILWITGAWLFAMTDLGTLLNKFTVDVLPAMGEHYDGSEGWLFAPAVVILWWLIKTQQDSQEPLLQRLHRLPAVNKLLIGHALGFSLALALLLIRGSAIHLDTRFLRPAAIAIMPSRSYCFDLEMIFCKTRQRAEAGAFGRRTRQEVLLCA